MTPEEIFKTVVDKFGEEVAFDFHDGSDGDKDAWCQIEAYSIEDVCKFLKTDPDLHMDSSASRGSISRTMSKST